MKYGNYSPSIPALRDPCGRVITRHRIIPKPIWIRTCLIQVNELGVRTSRSCTASQFYMELKRLIGLGEAHLETLDGNLIVFQPVVLLPPNSLLGAVDGRRYDLRRTHTSLSLLEICPNSSLWRAFNRALTELATAAETDDVKTLVPG